MFAKLSSSLVSKNYICWMADIRLFIENKEKHSKKDRKTTFKIALSEIGIHVYNSLSTLSNKGSYQAVSLSNSCEHISKILENDVNIADIDSKISLTKVAEVESILMFQNIIVKEA